MAHNLREGSPHRLRPEIPQLPQSRRMESAGLHTRRPQRPQTQAHLFSGARGKRQSHHPLRHVPANNDTVGDAVRDGAGLARTGARQHAHRAVKLRHHTPLIRVQTGEDILG